MLGLGRGYIELRLCETGKSSCSGRSCARAQVLARTLSLVALVQGNSGAANWKDDLGASKLAALEMVSKMARWLTDALVGKVSSSAEHERCNR